MVTKKKKAPAKKPTPSLTPIYDAVSQEQGIDPSAAYGKPLLSALTKLLNVALEADVANRCLDCGVDNLDTDACPGNRGYCLDCCHCPEHDPDYTENIENGKGR